MLTRECRPVRRYYTAIDFENILVRPNHSKNYFLLAMHLATETRAESSRLVRNMGSHRREWIRSHPTGKGGGGGACLGPKRF